MNIQNVPSATKRIPKNRPSIDNNLYIYIYISIVIRCNIYCLDSICVIQIQIQNCLFDIVCQVIKQDTLCIINVRRLPLRQ